MRQTVLTAPTAVRTVAAARANAVRYAIRKTVTANVRDMFTAARPKPVPALPALPVPKLSTKPAL